MGGAAVKTDAVIGSDKADERRTVRQQKSRPLLDALQPWLRGKLALISQKRKLTKAIRHALSCWDGLTRFIEDGRIELDNNTVEHSIRPIALNRKNALFAGSDGGAEHWATTASLQTERRRPARVSVRRSHQDRQRSSGQRHRRPAAVGLQKVSPEGRGLERRLPLKRPIKPE